MNILDKIFVGNVIQDFGVFDERSIGIGKMKHSALLAEKHGRYLFVVKFTAWAILGFSTSYQKFEMQDAAKLRDFINESEQIIQSTPPIDCDVAKIAVRNMLIALAVASVAVFFFPSSPFTFFGGLFSLVFQISQVTEFRTHPGMNERAKRYLFILLMATIVVFAIGLFWPLVIQPR